MEATGPRAVSGGRPVCTCTVQFCSPPGQDVSGVRPRSVRLCTRVHGGRIVKRWSLPPSLCLLSTLLPLSLPFNCNRFLLLLFLKGGGGVLRSVASTLREVGVGWDGVRVGDCGCRNHGFSTPPVFVRLPVSFPV